jgi:hypothetical protein
MYSLRRDMLATVTLSTYLDAEGLGLVSLSANASPDKCGIAFRK